MDVHHCRFSEWMPSAVCAMAFHPELPFVVIGRENGDIEMWNTEEKWFCESKISGHENLSIRSLIWSECIKEEERKLFQYRLFGSGLQGQIFEVNLQELRLMNQCDSYGGPVWMADRNPNNNTLACACEDGSLRLFDITGERISYLRCKSRIVSCGWSNDGNAIVCGSGSSHAYIYHFDTSKTDSIVVGYSMFFDYQISETKGDDTIVWNTKFISSSQYYNITFSIYRIATGDSRGQVQIWDISKHIMQQILKVHEGDVLTMSVFTYIDRSGDDSDITVRPTTLIVSGGVDSKICVFRNTDSAQKWTHTASYRSHTHDILCSAVHVLRGNYSTLYATSLGKEVKKEVTHIVPRVNPFVETAVLSRKRDAAQLDGVKRVKMDRGMNEALESGEGSIPVFWGLRDTAPCVLAIVSGGAEGALVVYNTQSHLESMTVKLLGYPGYYAPAVRSTTHHAVMMYDHSIDLVRLGESDDTVAGRRIENGQSGITKEEDPAVVTRLALATGFQNVLRLHMDGGRNTGDVAMLERGESLYVLVRDMMQLKLFRYDTHAQTVSSSSFSNLQCDLVELPMRLRSRAYAHIALFSMSSSDYLLAAAADGYATIFSLEGEEQIHGSLFTGVTSSSQCPITSILLGKVEAKKEKVTVAFTTMGHGLYRAVFDIRGDSIEVTPLPSPPLPITCMTWVQSVNSFHLTRLKVAQSPEKCHDTLVVALSDTTIMGYDVKSASINREYSLLSWLVPLKMIRDVDVITWIMVRSNQRLIVMCSKDHMMVSKLRHGKDFSYIKNLQDVLDGDTNTISRLTNSKEHTSVMKEVKNSIDMKIMHLQKYKNMLCFNDLQGKEVLIVERPILDVVANLPKVVYRRRYGI